MGGGRAASSFSEKGREACLEAALRTNFRGFRNPGAVRLGIAQPTGEEICGSSQALVVFERRALLFENLDSCEEGM